MHPAKAKALQQRARSAVSTLEHCISELHTAFSDQVPTKADRRWYEAAYASDAPVTLSAHQVDRLIEHLRDVKLQLSKYSHD